MYYNVITRNNNDDNRTTSRISEKKTVTYAVAADTNRRNRRFAKTERAKHNTEYRRSVTNGARRKRGEGYTSIPIKIPLRTVAATVRISSVRRRVRANRKPWTGWGRSGQNVFGQRSRRYTWSRARRSRDRRDKCRADQSTNGNGTVARSTETPEPSFSFETPTPLWSPFPLIPTAVLSGDQREEGRRDTR